MREEYKRSDLGKGTRGKYHAAYEESHNVVVLKPEIAKAFPTDKAVNDALSSLLELAKVSVHSEQKTAN